MKTLIYLSIILFCQIVLSQSKKAFIIGVSEYQDTNWNTLHSAEDAKDFRNYLVDFKDFKQENIVVLTSKEETYHDAVMDRLDDFIENNVAEKDTIIFFFSGHGQRVEDLSGDEQHQDGLDESLILYDTPKTHNPNDNIGLSKHLIDDDLGKIFNEIRRIIGKKGFLFVFIDSCFSGYTNKPFQSKTTDKGTTDIYKINKSEKKAKNDSINLDDFEDNNKEFSNAIFLAASTNTVAKEINEYNRGALTYYFLEVMKETKKPLSFELMRYKVQQKIDTKGIPQKIWMPENDALGHVFFLSIQKKLYPNNETFFSHTFTSNNNYKEYKHFPYGKIHGLNEGAILKVVNRVNGEILGYAKVDKSNLFNSVIFFNNDLWENSEILSQSAFVPVKIPLFEKVYISKKSEKSLQKYYPTLYRKLKKNKGNESQFTNSKKSFQLEVSKNYVTIYNNNQNVYTGKIPKEIYAILCKESFYNYLKKEYYTNKKKPDLNILKVHNQINEYCFHRIKNTYGVLPVIIDFTDKKFSQILPNNETIPSDIVISSGNIYSNRFTFNINPTKEILLLYFSNISNLKEDGIPSLNINKSIFNLNNAFNNFYTDIDATLEFKNNDVKPRYNPLEISHLYLNCSNPNCLEIFNSYDCPKN